MLEKIRKALLLHGFMLPGSVKEVLYEFGAELDRLRAEINLLRSQSRDDGK